MRSHLTVLVLIALSLAGCSSGQGTPQPGESGSGKRTTKVIVQPVAYEPEQVRLQAVGTSRAVKSLVLHPPSGGEVKAIGFAAGQWVQKGDVLLELDSRDERLALELARVRLQEAERVYRRYLKSQRSGAVTASDLDAARTAVDSARIELNRAEVALEDRFLKAPFAGRVGVTDVDVGARVSQDTQVTTLDDRSVLRVSFEVPETLMGRLTVGDPVSLSTWSADAAPVTGHVAEIDSRIDAGSRTFIVRAEVSNSDDRLRPGMSFRVDIAVDGKQYPVVPEVALQWGGAGSFVWLVDEGKARRVPATIVQRREGRVLVEAGLVEGALVVREGVQRMRDGLAVSHENADPEPVAGR